MSKSVSRRDFLRVASIGATGVLLAACQPKVVEVTKLVERVVKETVVVEGEVKTVEKIVKETVVVEKIVEKEPAASTEKIVRIIIDSWAVGEIPFDATAREFNASHDGVTVEIQTRAEGWDTKILAGIKSGSVQWSGLGIMSTDYHPAAWVESGLIMGMDEYVAASQEPGADTILTDMIPTVKAAGVYKGELIGLPYSFENCTFNWRTDYFNAIGVTEPPEDWEEWIRIAKELKAWGADEEIYPTALARDMTTTLMCLLAGTTDMPYTDEGLVDWGGDKMLEVFSFIHKLVVEEELTPPHGYDGWLDAFYSGKVASVHAQSSRGVWGQNAFGTDKMTTSPYVRQYAGGGSGAPYWGNDISIIKGAPYPQEATDYLIYTMGPQNVGFQKIVIKTGKTPIYFSIYETVIKGDPQFRTYQWMIPMLDDVADAVPLPQTTYIDIQYSAYNKHFALFTEPGATMTPGEIAQSILKDVKEEVAKQKL
jgi:ABC-type glycerol-3-phosphate transport system substrate-binding protein